MDSTRIGTLAGSVTMVAWATKAVTIAAAGGLNKSPLEGPLFLLGLASMLVACAALGVSTVARRGHWIRALTGAVTIVTAIGASLVINWAVGRVEPEHPGWAWGEVNLWVLALVVLAVSLLHGRRNRVAVEPDFR